MADNLGGVEILEPKRLPKERQQGIIPNRARPKATSERKVERIAKFAPLPFCFVECFIHWPAPFFLPAATTTSMSLGADKKVAGKLDDAEIFVSGGDFDGVEWAFRAG